MEPMETPVRRFMEKYAQWTARGEMEAVAVFFADDFMAAGPQGAQSVKASEFALALPKRKELFDRMGCTKTELIGLEEQALDARYTLARTRWRLTFEPAGRRKEEVLVDSVYLVDCGVNPFRFVLYLANQDIFAILKERGILRT
ncbi:MAG TPA: hypothetical protein VK716_16440 [Terracidiphilus sp.]|jgi:hypothetical protein|nr:hypothetical protein [Terracidiphilus sp.]